jgi:hypothetical protein
MARHGTPGKNPLMLDNQDGRYLLYVGEPIPLASGDVWRVAQEMR